MSRSQISRIVSPDILQKEVPQDTIFLLAVALEISEDPMDKLDTFLVYFLLLLIRKKTISEVQKKNDKVSEQK